MNISLEELVDCKKLFTASVFFQEVPIEKAGNRTSAWYTVDFELEESE